MISNTKRRERRRKLQRNETGDNVKKRNIMVITTCMLFSLFLYVCLSILSFIYSRKCISFCVVY